MAKNRKFLREPGQGTGKIYLGACLNAMIVTWMYVSSQVVAPIPV